METLHERSFAYDDEENSRLGTSGATDIDVLAERLRKVRSAVQKATQEAWKQANGHSPSLSALQKENASFLLGMDLFGNGGGDHSTGGDSVVASTSGLEMAVRDKLDQVERDLARIQKESNALPIKANEKSTLEESFSSSDIDSQIESYRRKVGFLKQASYARGCIEESSALSSSSAGTSEGNTGTPDNLVRSAQALLRAEEELSKASVVLKESGTSDSPKEVEIAYRILSSLRHQIRRQRIELVHKAGSVLDGSVELTPSSIAVKSSSQLSIAYEVLETLDSGSFQRQTGNKPKTSALQDTMREFTSRLYDDSLKPLLKESCIDQSYRGWNVEETADRRSGMIGISAASKRGTMHRIEWNLIHGTEDRDSTITNENNTIEEEEEIDPSTFSVVRSWKKILNVLQGILVFVQSKVLLEREPLSSIMKMKLFGVPDAMPSIMNLSALGLQSTMLGEDDKGILAEAMLEWLRRESLSETQVEALSLDQISSLRNELVDTTTPFCEELQKRNLLQSDPPSRLLVFCESFEKNYIDQRRCLRLNQAREILLHNDYHNTTVVGVEESPGPNDAKEEAMAAFRLSKSSISDTANKLIGLVRDTMEEAVAVVEVPQESPLAILRPTLYKTAREMFSLFRSIIPANHGLEVANVPRTAAVLHNDAVFFAHHCLTLGLEYKEKFPQVEDGDARGKLLKQTCIFVDMVPLFRELADTALNDMLDLQKQQLGEIVGSRITYFGQSLRSEESVHEWSEAETALAAGIYHLRHLAQAWKSILSTPVFLRSMGYLADVLFSLYLNEMTANTNIITASARQFAASLFRKATVDIFMLLFQNEKSFVEDRGKPDPKLYSLEWGRFEAIGNFLEMDQLVHVEQALSSGEFRSVASQELSSLIQATYPDSPHRKALLHCMASVV